MNDNLRRDFVNPPLEFRPLQIIHGFEALGTDAAGIGNGLEGLRAAGCGGVVANVGWPGYLRDEERWRVFLLGAEEARKRDLALWIYDEWGYPSGQAGDIVLDGHPELEARGLVCASVPVDAGQAARIPLPAGAERWASAVAILPEKPNSQRIAQRIPLTVSGDRPIEWHAPAGPGPWLLYGFATHVMFEDTHATLNVMGRRRYVNLLDARVGRSFVQATHEEYSRRMTPQMLANVRATFADEPSLIVAYFNDPRWSRPPALPWCDDFPQEFERRAGYALEPYLPELFFTIGDGLQVRCDFQRVVAELLCERFFAPIQEWCRAHGIASSGHLLTEERLSWHVWMEGDAFACLRRFDWPGIDILSSVPEEIMAGEMCLTPKFVSSAAHLMRSPIVMSESSSYIQSMAGKTVTIAQMAGTAGLQYALGVNLITSYYGWGGYSHDDTAAWLRGEAPTPENGYRAYCDYVGRLGVMLRGGRHVCGVAVYYPVCTMQARFTPSDRSYMGRDAIGPRATDLDTLLRDLTRGLLQRQVDFDFVDDQALADADISEGREPRASLRVGDEEYRVLVLPGATVIPRDTLAAVVRFAQAGGAVIAVGDLPQRTVRTDEGEAAATLVEQLRAAGLEAVSLDAALEATLKKAGPEVAVSLASPHILTLHRVRYDGLHVYFITNTSGDACEPTVRVRRTGDAWVCWPRTGAIEARAIAADGISLALAPYEGVFILLQ